MDGAYCCKRDEKSVCRVKLFAYHPFTHDVLEDVAFGKEGYWRFYPSIMVNAQKDLVIGFSETGTHTYPGAYFTGRRDSDPLGLSTSVPLKED